MLTKSQTAFIPWTLCLLFSSLIIGVSYSFLSNSTPIQGEWISLILAWTLTIVFIIFSLQTPCYYAELKDDTLILTWQYPLKRVVKTIPIATLDIPAVDKHIDSDGDAHYSLEITLPDGDVFVFAQSTITTGSTQSSEKNRKYCEKIRALLVKTKNATPINPQVAS